MRFNVNAMGCIQPREHSCLNETAVYIGRQVSEEMKPTAEMMAAENRTLPAVLNWEAMGDQSYGPDVNFAVKCLSSAQVIARVYRARSLHYNGDIHGKTKRPPLCLVQNKAINFSQFHLRTQILHRSRIVSSAGQIQT